MSNRKLYVIGGASHYINWMGGKLTSKIEDADAVILTGGEDVSPHLYKEKSHSTTYANIFRDEYEVRMFKRGLELGKKFIGICRGAQFLCVMAGGSLVQHQENPKYIHKIKTFNGKEIWVNSTHHQAQYPWKLSKDSFKILAWSENVSRFHLNGDDEEIVANVVDGNKEIEMVHYPHIKALGIQSHPEMLYHDMDKYKEVRESVEFCRFLLNSHLNNTL